MRLPSEDQLFDSAQKMLNRDWRGEERISRDSAGKKKIPFGKEVAETKQGSVTQFAIVLQLLGQGLTIIGCSGLIHENKIGMKPACHLQGERSVALLVNGIPVFQSATDRAGKTRFMID